MKILKEINEWFEALFIRNVPGGTGVFLRRLYWKSKLSKSSFFTVCPGCVIMGAERVKFGKKVIISRNCSLFADGNGSIQLGDYAGLNNGVILGASRDGKIVLGNNVLVGFNVVMRASNHRYDKKNVPIRRQAHAGGKIVIEDDVWIGANSTILSGVTIGRGAVIGAGAVVNKNVPPYALAAGVPAKVIRENCRT